MDFTLKIGGEAGQGIASSGLIFSKLALRSGYFVFDWSEYPSLIRGGHNVVGVRVSDQKIFAPLQPLHLLLALDQKSLALHGQELAPGSGVIFDPSQSKTALPAGVQAFPVPLRRLTEEVGTPPVMVNNVALGGAAFLLGADFGILKSVIRDVFGHSKPDLVDLNVKAAKAGFDFAGEHFKNTTLVFALKTRKNEPQLLLTGNDALALGAIRAGLGFFAAYPMTPINSLITYFAAKAKESGLVYYQPEDEIAGINAVIGASLTGSRSLVATSGGGFSLMVEALGLAGMTETPLVILLGQRPGPSTGLPTWTSQADLRFALHAGQDEFPRIVLAPGDAEECFWLTVEAFNLADTFQLPVIILSDKYLAESHQSLAVFDESRVKIERGPALAGSGEYRRYRLTESGISPRALVGQKNLSFISNSDEHDEFGFSDESAENRRAMMEKRMRKMETLAVKTPAPKIYGRSDENILLLGWGSTKGPVLEAQKILSAQKIETQFLHLNFVHPFPAAAMAEAAGRAKKVLLVEQNFSGQLAGLIREKTGIKIESSLLKYDGRQFYPEEIAERVKQMV